MVYKLYNRMLATLLSIITVLQLNRKISLFLTIYNEAFRRKLTIMTFKKFKRALYTYKHIFSL